MGFTRVVCACATPGYPPTAAPEHMLEFMFVRKAGKINYWQQERAQYVAACTNVLVYIARYNKEASVKKENSICFPFKHLHILVCA